MATIKVYDAGGRVDHGLTVDFLFPVSRNSQNPRQSHNRDFRDGMHPLDSGGEHSSESPCPMMIGYARVSTEGQTLDQQRAALKAAGCKRVFEEKASGAQRGRPELAKLLDHLGSFAGRGGILR